MTKDEPSFERVIATADLMSFYRGFSDIPFAAEISKLLNAEAFARGLLGGSFEQAWFLAPMAEARYKRINGQLRGFQNVLELGVGPISARFEYH